MDSERYGVFEFHFREAALPILEELRASLKRRGFSSSEIEVVDHDVSRGLAFEVSPATNSAAPAPMASRYIELTLEDGDVHGYEGVGLVLSCSIYASGQIWAPGNFTAEVGIESPERIADRFMSFDAESIADAAIREWDAVGAREAAEEQDKPAPEFAKSPDDEFYIVNLSHHRGDQFYISIWRPADRGYAYPLEWAGKYKRSDIEAHLGYYNSGDNIAIPTAVIEALAIEPLVGQIDGDAGPVVPNTKESWAPILAAIEYPTKHPVKPKWLKNEATINAVTNPEDHPDRKLNQRLNLPWQG